MSATVNLISQDTCKNKYYDSIRVTDNMVCAGDPTWETDACKVKLFLNVVPLNDFNKYIEWINCSIAASCDSATQESFWVKGICCSY